jgi:hypothetical protein
MPRFPEFWDLYPRKVARKSAEKAWEKNKCEPIADKIIAGLKKQLPYMTDAKFIPHPATWINTGRYEDQLHVDVRPARQQSTFEPTPWRQLDDWRAMLNVWILAIVKTRGGVEIEILRKLVAERNRLADQCRTIWGEKVPWEDEPPGHDNLEILDGMLKQIESI